MEFFWRVVHDCLMSYASIHQAEYSVLYPHSMTHAGSYGWTRSPMPSWGENPLRAGPAVLGETEAERNAGMAIAMQAAGAAAQKASDSAAIVGSANQIVAQEDKQIATNPELTELRQQYEKVSAWPFVAVGVAGLAGVALIVYSMRRRHG